MTCAAESKVNDVVISARELSKSYKLYPSHKERLKEALHPFRKRYHKEFQALSGVSFEILKGQSVGILGRNGAGKSTLLQLIAGVLTPSSGTVSVSGRVAALLELGAGFNSDLTGRENVILSNTINGLPERDMPDLVARVEAFADIGVFFDQPMKIYSSGMFARVAFANAIQVNPDVLIVDEILGVGDAKFQEKCYDRIRTLRDQGASILFVSHSTDVIQRNCETALLLEAGKVVSYGESDEAVAAYNNMMYGSPKPMGSALVPAPPRGGVSGKDEVAQGGGPREFFEGIGEPLYSRFHYYNSHERRIGSGEAEIVDFIVSANGNYHFSELEGNETLSVLIKVHFNRDVEAPHVGWAIASQEGIVIAGSNTFLSNSPQLPYAQSNSVCIYAVEMRPMLCAGQYFINIGILERRNGDWIYFDVRRSAIHLSVMGSGRSNGFFEMPSACSVVDVLGNVERGQAGMEALA